MSTQKPEKIPSNTIRANPKYLRLKINEDHMQAMFDKMQDTKSDWPFNSPAHIAPIPIGEEKLIQEGYRYYYIDGHHRGAAALKNGTPVTAIVHSGLTPLDAIAMQVSTNVENGLAFNHAARKRAVDALKEAGMAQVEIAKKTGLPKYTISRILSKTPEQIMGGSETPQGQKGPKKAKQFDTEKWENALSKIMKDWETYRRKISKIKGFPEGLEEALDAVQDCLTRSEELE